MGRPQLARIAFDSNRDGNREIYVMTANGTGQVRLTSQVAEAQDVTLFRGRLGSPPGPSGVAP
jgi:Tol biopolymer transport system component